MIKVLMLVSSALFSIGLVCWIGPIVLLVCPVACLATLVLSMQDSHAMRQLADAEEGTHPELGMHGVQAVHTIIYLEHAAPVKPAAGQSCNGCGVCCASEPCPLGMLVSRRTQGACRALVWGASDRRYRCGLIADPMRYLPVPVRWCAPLLSRLAGRFVAAGTGCDSSVSTHAS